MSLFPAYADNSTAENATSTSESNQWLKNISFQVDLQGTEKNDKEAKLEHISKKRKKSKHSEHKKEPKAPEKELKEDLFTIDLKGSKEFLTVKTISRPSVPIYRTKYYIKSTRNSNYYKTKLKRYYQTGLRKEIENNSPDSKINQENSLQHEQDLSNTTGIYNKKLEENPGDIQLWLEYVNFQDTIYQFEKTYRKGSIAKGLRVLAERKLLILDKALSFNPNCEELLRHRLNVAVSCYPADELQTYHKNLVDKDQGNIILWQGYIEATQCSMSHCNTPAVIGLYTSCLSTLHKLRRNSAIEKSLLEENILKMLYQCGLFLKQAGLFEQLWTLLRLYLELNLSPTDPHKFNISSGASHDKLIELEEVVFNSQLPLHELWLRTEKLREACHWVPLTDGECEDPQRLVFPEDVAELIHPITMADNTFKLIATILTLLKIPLLPCRHTTMAMLGLDYVPWAFDSIEPLLPIFSSSHPVDLNNKNIVIDPRLSVGPQYLNVLPGQAEYLDFVLKTMKSCIESANGDDKTATTLWWMRFQRLLVVLDKQKRFKLPLNYSKRIKEHFKNLLKMEENRNNILYYLEYALLEHELGNTQSSLGIIQTALNFTTNQGISVLTIDEKQVQRCFLYKTLIELHLKIGSDVKEVLTIIICYVLEKKSLVLSNELIQECSVKLKHITLQLIQKETKILKITDHFLPDFLTDWITINGWFLYLTSGPLESGKFIENILEKLQDDKCYQQEVLYENYVTILFNHCSSNPGSGIFAILNEVLHRAIAKFPNNLFLLSVLAKEQSIFKSSTSSWWKLKTTLIKTGHAFPILFLLLIANQQVVEARRMVVETGSGENFIMNDSCKNRILALFKKITRPEMCTRRCGLVWRLYLQFVHEYFDPGICRNVYYSAVEECPWLKTLYIDAAIYIPAELTKIQDLLIEKQLRLHVTPEELDVLRS